MAATKKLELKCPHCGAALDPKLIKRMAGKIVGSIKGKAKARPSAVARAAVMKRWEKKKAAQEARRDPKLPRAEVPRSVLEV